MTKKKTEKNILEGIWESKKNFVKQFIFEAKEYFFAMVVVAVVVRGTQCCNKILNLQSQEQKKNNIFS